MALKDLVIWIALIWMTPICNAYILRAFTFVSHHPRALTTVASQNDRKSSDVHELSKFIAPIVLGTILSTSFSSASLAQIPSIDDYNSGSGSVITGVKQQITAEPSAAVKLAVKEKFTFSHFSADLDLIEKLIGQKSWDDTFQLTTFLKKIVNLDHFGYTSTKTLAESSDLSTEQVEKIESQKDEISFNIGQINDLALSRRVIFFNKADLEQVGLIIAEEGSEEKKQSSDEKEAVGILNDIRDLIK